MLKRADDAVLALPLYTSAVEGSRSGKRKKKTELQKTMIKDLKVYDKAIEQLEAAVKRKDGKKASAALADMRSSLKEYRELAQIDGEDGGVINLPLGNAEEVRKERAVAPLPQPIPAH